MSLGFLFPRVLVRYIFYIEEFKLCLVAQQISNILE